ncbi:hypothetical protein F4775DRAFT_587881 [Biscogniauxia sp. FL1348]|nr:hypothetical protein F4775DRAFT_587881 [Biscogniauxia sp. FL1348]
MEDSLENGHCKKHGRPTRPREPSEEPAANNWVSVPAENGPENEYIIYSQPADVPLPEQPDINYRRGMPQSDIHPEVEQSPGHVNYAESLQPDYVVGIQEYIENISVSTPEPSNGRQHGNSELEDLGSYPSIPSLNPPTFITITPTPETDPSAEDLAHSPVHSATPSSLSSPEADSHANSNASDLHEEIPEFPSYHSFSSPEEPSNLNTTMDSFPSSPPGATGNYHRQHHLTHVSEDPQGGLDGLGDAKLKVDGDGDVDMEPRIEDLGSDALGGGGGGGSDAEIRIDAIYEDADADGDEHTHTYRHEQSAPNWVQKTLSVDSIPVNSRRTSDPAVLLYGRSPLRQVMFPSWEVGARFEGLARPMKRLRLDRSGRASGFVVDGQNAGTRAGVEATIEPRYSPLPLIQSRSSPELGHDARPTDGTGGSRANLIVPAAATAGDREESGGDTEMEEQEEQELTDDENKENVGDENVPPAPTRSRTRRGGTAVRVPLQAGVEEIEIYSHPHTQE